MKRYLTDPSRNSNFSEVEFLKPGLYFPFSYSVENTSDGALQSNVSSNVSDLHFFFLQLLLNLIYKYHLYRIAVPDEKSE